MTGLRERKKQRTRRALAATARRLYRDRGFSATTVEDICAACEVSPSTFFRYFPSKECAAFPEAEERIRVVREVLERAPADEPLHVTVRRAVHAVADLELEQGDDARLSYELLRREPALETFHRDVQARVAETCAAIVGRRLGVDPATDLRPALLVGAVFAAVNAAWGAWLASGMAEDLHALVDEAQDVLDAGLAAEAQSPSPSSA